jgi:hypothetical protein
MSMMRYGSKWRLFSLFLIVLASMTWHQAARASSDAGCDSPFANHQHHYPGCDGGSMAFLLPDNDTRIDLILLLADMHGMDPKMMAAAGSANPPRFGLGDLEQLVPDTNPPTVQGFDEPNTCNQPAEDAFEEALKDERALPSVEHDLLVNLHQQMTLCSKDKPSSQTGFKTQLDAAASQFHSVAGKAYFDYLQAAAAFYDYHLSNAVDKFAALTRSDSSWLRETSLYLLGRSAVRAVQVGAFDDEGSMKTDWKADPAVVAHAHTALDAYLQAYPDGLYAFSARGLQRRVDWLSGDRAKLTDDYVRALAQDEATRGISDEDLAQEIDSKLFTLYSDASPDEAPPGPHVDTTDPTLLAVLDLYDMRRSAEDEGKEDPTASVTRQELEAQRSLFAHQPALFEYLLALHAYYIDHKPQEVLDLIPDNTRQAKLSYVEFSRQMLRGLALQAMEKTPTHEKPAARKHFVAMLPGATAPFQRSALELAIAQIDEGAGQVPRLFETGSPVHNPDIRSIELSYIADAPLLRKQQRDNHAPDFERRTALFVLLYKELTRGFYADYLHDKALIPPDTKTAENVYGFSVAPGLYPYPDANAQTQPLGVFLAAGAKDGYKCPALQDTVTTLAKNANDSKGKLCLAEFVRLAELDDFTLDHPPSDQLGSGKSMFPGQPYSRLEVYKSIIDDAAASSDDKAYALYRAVYCYAPVGNNSCGGKNVAAAQRKAWFLRLKKQYASSHWADTLDYYW